MLYPAAAQVDAPCPEGAISDVYIANHSIFRSDPAEERRVSWAYDLVNTLHMKTREDFIARELLFREGDCFNPALLAESERLLRDFRFISDANITSIPRSDGSQLVIVDTRDEWTTRVNLGIAVERGLRIEGLDIKEENFLGRGMLVGAYLQERDERRDFGLAFETPLLLGTRWNAGINLGRTRVGWMIDQRFIFPFASEFGRLAARQRYSRREAYFNYVTGGEEQTHVVVPVLDESFEVAGAIRFGTPGSLTMVGFGISRDALSFLDYPTRVEAVQNGNFGDLAPVSQETVRQLQPQITPRATARLNLLLGQRNVRFERRRGLDALKGVQDVQLGSEISLVLARSFNVLRTDPAPNDLFARVDIFAGATPGNWVLQGKLNSEGRRVFETAGRTWRDVFTEFDSYVYFQPSSLRQHTLVGRFSVSGGWGVEAPFQLTLGGRDGLRGYRREAFPVGRRTLLSLEDRIALDWPAPGFMDFGFTLFGDAGMGMAGDVPFGLDSGWKASAGAGIRLGFPAGTGRVVRLDFAIPVERRSTLGDVVFRLSIGEALGIARGFGDPQMERSLRAGVTSDFTGLAH